MTREEAGKLKLKMLAYLTLENGGHAQIKGNAKHGIFIVFVKETRLHDWRAYWAVCPTHRDAIAEGVEELTKVQAIERVMLQEYLGPDDPKVNPMGFLND